MTHQCTCPTCAERGEAIDAAYDHLLACGYAHDGMLLSLLSRHTSSSHGSDVLQRRLQDSIVELQRQAEHVEQILRDEPPRKPWFRWWRK